MKKFAIQYIVSFLSKLFSSLLILVVTTGVSMAQASEASAGISGLLMDDSGKPLAYATVSLLTAGDSSVVKGVISSEQGVYTFGNVKAGAYLIEASAVGYRISRSQQITVTYNSTVTVPVLIIQSNSNVLNAVTVTASKPLIERKIDRTVVNVENSPLAAGNSAMDILERAPLVFVDKDGNISLKGKQAVTVMINDKLTYLSTAQLATLLRSTDGNTIKSIEIITNPSAKYDAAGNSGIINIKLKKNKQAGTNGALTLGTARGSSWRNNETLQLNHKRGNLNVFGTFSHNDAKNIMDVNIKRIVSDSAGHQTYFNQFTPLTSNSHNNSYRGGADYDLSPKNTIGFVISGYFNSGNDNNDNRTYIGRDFKTFDSSLHTVSAIHQTYKNFAANLSDAFKIDTSGQQINLDLDYATFKNYANSLYRTDYFLADGSRQNPESFLNNLTPSTIDIQSTKLDYTKPLNQTVKFEAGFKFSNVKTENDLKESLVENIPARSINHFIYDEKIGAAYLNLNKQYKSTSLQLGLRTEYTSSTAEGDSASIIKRIPRDYFDLFPSVFISHTIDDKNEFSLSYSRRIDRPQYDDLNPFTYHFDPYTYQIGNPYLKPQYSNNFEVNYTYNKKITTTLGYSRTTDVITQLPGTNQATKETFIFLENLQIQNDYNVNIYAPYTITKWWEGDINATGLYQGFKSKNLEGSDLNSGQAGYQFRATQRLTPVLGFKIELTGNYQSAVTYGLFYIKPIYYVDAGIGYSFAKKKATIKFSVSDLFNIRRNDVTSKYGSNDLDFRQKRETRVARLTFTYNFGSTKIGTREHQSGTDDLNGRVKGSN